MAGLTPEIIKELVAPALIIPACGLLCLSTNARMMSVLGRLRSLHNERVAMYVDDPGENPRKKRARAVRGIGIDHQTSHMLRRLHFMKRTMMLLFTAIILLLVSSALIGIAAAWELDAAGAGAVIVFVLGGGCMASAMGVSLFEMAIGLRAVTYEHDRVCALPLEDEGDTHAGGDL